MLAEHAALSDNAATLEVLVVRSVALIASTLFLLDEDCGCKHETDQVRAITLESSSDVVFPMLNRLRSEQSRNFAKTICKLYVASPNCEELPLEEVHDHRWVRVEHEVDVGLYGVHVVAVL